jgi:SAM-dependent methyltransferase
MTAALTIDNPAYFDRLARVEVEHWWSQGMWQLASYWLGAELRGRRRLAALDVGCGTGMTMVRLQQRPEIDRIVGLDPSPDALVHASRRHGFPLVRGSALELPFDDAQFDVVTAFDVLQHVPPGTVVRAIGELHRVLRPGGIVLIRSNARGRRPATGLHGMSYRLADLVERFATTGFQVRRACHVNCLPALAQEVRARVLGSGRSRSAGHPAGSGLRIDVPNPWLNRVMRLISGAEAVLAGRLGVLLPYGHSSLLLAIKQFPLDRPVVEVSRSAPIAETTF